MSHLFSDNCHPMFRSTHFFDIMATNYAKKMQRITFPSGPRVPSSPGAPGAPGGPGGPGGQLLGWAPQLHCAAWRLLRPKREPRVGWSTAGTRVTTTMDDHVLSAMSCRMSILLLIWEYQDCLDHLSVSLENFMSLVISLFNANQLWLE